MTHRELSEGLNDLIFNLSLEYEREQMNQDKNNPNYIENFIKKKIDKYNGDIGHIPTGCMVSGSKVQYREKNMNKIFTWSNTDYQCYYGALLQNICNIVIHPINLQNLQKNILTNKQIVEIEEILVEWMNEYPYTDYLSKIPKILHKFYFFPSHSGTIIFFYPKFHQTNFENYIKENPLSETDFEMLSEKLYGTSGYRGTELSILIKDEEGNIKFEDIEREEYYPIWQLYNQNITPNIIEQWDSYIEYYKISDFLGFCIDGNEVTFIKLKDMPNSQIKILEDDDIILFKDYTKVNQSIMETHIGKKDMKICISNNRSIFIFKSKQIIFVDDNDKIILK